MEKVGSLTAWSRTIFTGERGSQTVPSLDCSLSTSTCIQSLRPSVTVSAAGGLPELARAQLAGGVRRETRLAIAWLSTGGHTASALPRLLMSHLA